MYSGAIRWIAQAWDSVSSDTIKKCFRKARVLDKDFKVVSEVVVTGDDLFADLDAESGDVVDHGHRGDYDVAELTRLVEQVCEV